MHRYWYYTMNLSEVFITFLSPLRVQEWPHRVISFYSYCTGHSRLTVASTVSSIVISKLLHRTILVTIVASIYSVLKVSSLYNIGHNKCKELLPTKFQFKVDKNPTWRGSWMLLDALFHVEKGLLARPWRMLCWRSLQFCKCLDKGHEVEILTTALTTL
jgi:hypothetical protein